MGCVPKANNINLVVGPGCYMISPQYVSAQSCVTELVNAYVSVFL